MDSIKAHQVTEIRRTNRVVLELSADDAQEFVAQHLADWLGEHPAGELLRNMGQFAAVVTTSLRDRANRELGPITVTIEAVEFADIKETPL